MGEGVQGAQVLGLLAWYCTLDLKTFQCEFTVQVPVVGRFISASLLSARYLSSGWGILAKKDDFPNL